MADNHRIIELLTRGVTPTAEEAQDLAGVGVFASRLYGRYLGGLRLDQSEQAGARTVRWANKLAAGLSARTAERWTTGLGLSSALFEGGWSGLWRCAGGVRPGYDIFDPEMTSLALEDDDFYQADQDDGPLRRRSRRSLFGSRADGREGTRSKGKREAGRSTSTQWLGGGDVSAEVVRALESGGLYLEDQLTPADAASRHRQRDGGRRPPRRITLDGMEVGAATPALASALLWAEGAFGDRPGAAPLAVTAQSAAGLLSHEPPRQRVGSDAHHRPVFAFFDSVEGDFVSLTPERVTEAMTNVARHRAEFPPQSQSQMTSSRTPVTEQPRVDRSPFDVRAPIATSLSEIVRPGSPTVTPGVQPFIHGMFPPPPAAPATKPRPWLRSTPLATPQFAATVARDARGRPVAGVQRSAMSAPRVGVVTPAVPWTLGAGGQGQELASGWRSAADLGPDLPLGASLTRHESMAGTITIARTSQAMGMGPETFSPLIASERMAAVEMAGAPRHERGRGGAPLLPWRAGASPAAFGDDVLDGVVWISVPADEVGVQRGPELTPMSVVPTGRVASMVPASAVVAGAVHASALLTRGVGGGTATTDTRERPPSPQEATTDRGFTAAGFPAPEPRAGALARSGVMLTPRRVSSAILAGLPSAVAASTEDAVEVWSPRAAQGLVSDLGGGVYAAGRSGLDITMVRQVDGAVAGPARASGEPPDEPQLSERVTARIAAEVAAREALGRPVMSDRDGPRPGMAAPAPMGIPGQDSVTLTRVARAALKRPVLTAREVMALASFAGPAGPASVVKMPAVDSPLGGPVEPSLVRYLNLTREKGQRALSGAAVEPPAAPFLAQLASLSPAQTRRAGRLFRRAGWDEPELQMLRLGDVPVDEAVHDAGGADQADRVMGEPRAPGLPPEAVASGASTRRMTRNLARVLTGTEALMTSAPPPGAPSALASSIESMLGGGGPFVAPTATERYFHTHAPARGRALPTSGLRDAVGELVAMAEEASRVEGPVSGDARQQLAGRVRAVHAALRDGLREQRAEAFATHAAAGLDAPATEATVSPGYLQLADVELGMLRLDEQPDAAHRTGGLSERIDRALASSASGPAGVDRLTRTLPTHPSLRAEGARAGRRSQSAAATETVALGAAVAPEAMLTGMRSEALGRVRSLPSAGRAAVGRRGAVTRREGVPGELTGLVAPPGELPGQVGAADEPTGVALGRQLAKGEARAAPAERFTRRSATRHLMSTLRRAGVSEESVDTGLLHGLVKRLQRTATGGSLRRGQLADFTMAWLERVDGNRTGLDLGMGDLQADVSRLIGAWASDRRSSRLAGQSPIDEAQTVVMPQQTGPVADRSGLRRAARQGFARGSGASRPRHHAAAAVQQADWKFVDTGSRAATPHADLGQLAARIMETSAVAGQAPMPLVAPAVKAVAQTALRKGREESMGGEAAASGAGAPGAADGAPSDAPAGAGKMGKAAFEKLAYEMADRIARRLKREQERRGQWP